MIVKCIRATCELALDMAVCMIACSAVFGTVVVLVKVVTALVE